MALQDGIAAALKAGLGASYKVNGYPTTPDAVEGKTVQVWATDIKHLIEAPNGHYLVTYTVLILTPHQDPKRAETDLAGSLEAVLGVLWNDPTHLILDGQRTVSEDNKVHSWTLTVSASITLTEA